MMLCVLVSLTWSGCIKKPPAGDVIAPLPIVSPEMEVQTPVPAAIPLPADTPVPTQTPAPTTESLSFRLERYVQGTASINEPASSGIPLLISTDVEGGSVTRFQWGRTTLAARTLGNREDTQQAQEQFAYIGEHLKERGINTDHAPVMDVARNPSATFLGKRIISSNAETVAAIGTACIEGLHEGGCLSVIKLYRVFISDDIRMKVFRNQVSHREAAVQFILAGGDIILCGANHSYQREILSGLAEAVENGVLTEERINESVLRILAAKMQVTDWKP